MDRPTGTVTFLFSDIEGSTQLWETCGEWMARAHARQEELLRRAFAAHGGYPYKMIGDAFQVAFASAPAALAAAIDAQRALAREPWGDAAIRVRIGIHTGETEERGDDYVGPLLNRVARLMSAGHGGQILVSQGTAELVRDRLPAGVSLRDLGERRLKDLNRPERIHQLVAPGLPAEFPPLRTLDVVPNNLPIQLTHFIGRERPLADLTSALGRSRLVTLTGAGGAGKTRLALQVASEIADRFPQGAWLAELAPIGDPREVPQAVASALGIQETAGRSIVEALASRLADEARLVILDNCEHLIAGVVQVVTTLLRASARSRVLVTSREPLRIAGEATYDVPSLELLDPRATASSELSRCEAVRLFADRAADASSAFALGESNVQAVAEICRRLDGIPLAIELAAARVRALPIEKIAERLSDRFKLLARGDRAALPRQQTLRALIDWSHDLLAEPERALLRRLAPFSGGFTIESAEVVCAGDDVAESDVLDLLTALTEKSLVVLEPSRQRYRLLETIREYAAEKLGASGEDDLVHGRHLAHYLELAEAAAAAIKEKRDEAWARRSLDAEHDNFMAALGWCERTPGRAGDGLRLVRALRSYWRARGLFEQGYRVTRQALDRPGAEAPTPLRGSVLEMLAMTAVPLGRFDDMHKHASEALAIGRTAGDEELVSFALCALACAAYNRGDLASGRRYGEEAIERSSSGSSALPLAHLALAEIHRHAGDLALAQPLYEASLAGALEAGNFDLGASNHLNLTMVAIGRGDLERAAEHLAAGLAFVAEHGLKMSGQTGLDVCAGLAAVRGEMRVAARLYGASEAHRLAIGAQREPVDEAWFAPLLARARASLPAAAFAAAESEGRALIFVNAVAEARAWLAGPR